MPQNRQRTHPDAPWFNDEIRQTKQVRRPRKAEKMWWSSILIMDLEMFKSAQCKVTDFCATEKSAFLCCLIEDNGKA